MKIFPERSLEVLEKLAKKINKSPLETAFGVIEIANANMEKAIRVISIERGFDQRNFALFSFGGAGGMHAAEIASHLQMKTVIVPKNAGVLSALGLLLADSIKDYSKSMLKTVDRIKPRELEDHFAELIRESLKEMKEDGFKENEISIERYLDLRYLGQSYEITIPFQSKKASPFSFLPYFHKEHRRLYSYHHPQRLVEIVNIRVKAVGQTKKIKLKKLQETRKTSERALLKKQAIYFDGKKYQGSVYDRSLLEPGTRVCGPALIVDFESTTFLPPHYLLKVDGFLNLIIQKG
jgi:N-methylhydantoinase A/oxoprolinase/acetone carboxylase beta subunit